MLLHPRFRPARPTAVPGVGAAALSSARPAALSCCLPLALLLGSASAQAAEPGAVPPAATTPAVPPAPMASAVPAAPAAESATATAEPSASSPSTATAAASSPPPAPAMPEDAPAGPPAFTVVVQSSDRSVQTLIDEHISLKRYAVIPDLDATELQRLMALSEQDVRNLLGALGYFNPEVTLKSEPAVGEQRPKVVVNVEPGPQTTIAHVGLEYRGHLADSNDAGVAEQRHAITEGWGLKAGESFSQSAWGSAKNNALRALVSKRYAAGKLTHSLADVDAPTNRAELHAVFESGPLYRLGPITVKGHERYDPMLAERLSWLEPGEIYDQKRLVEAQQRLGASGFYNAAYVTMDADGDPEAAPVTIQVREAKMQRLNLGLGYSTDSGPRLTLEHRHNKVPVLGWRAISKLHANAKTPLLESELMSVPTSSGWRWAALGRFERIDDDSLVTDGVRLRYGRVKSEEKYDRNIYLQYDRTRVKVKQDVRDFGQFSNREGDALIGDGSALSLNYAWTGRYFDNFTSPTRGYGLAFEVGGGTTMSGNYKPFVRATGRWHGFLPLGSGRLSMRTDAGAVVAHDEAAIPATYLFRTGGDTTVRGYRYRSLGLPLFNDLTLPGRYMASGSVEWQRPILQERLPGLLEHVLFVDAGGVGSRPHKIRAEVGVGTGVRANTPVGPLQLDLAYGLKAKAVRLHLTVGFVF